MLCDKLQRHSIRGVMYKGEEICEGFAYYDSDEVDAAIAELKAENERLKDELDAANNQCENLINSATDIMLSQDKANDAKCDEVESLKATHYAEMVDAGMRERRLQRALWLARAQAADGFATISRWTDYEDIHPDTKIGYRKWYKKFMHAKALCRAKAEEYK